MEIRRGPTTKQELASIVARVSNERYDGNVYLSECEPVRNNVLRFRLRTWRNDAGSRNASSGRRTRAACWHAWRDTLRAIFDAYPHAVITGGLYWRVKYDGMEGFMREYPKTAHVNIGSAYAPVAMPDLCACQSLEDAEIEGPCSYGRACLFGCQPVNGGAYGTLQRLYDEHTDMLSAHPATSAIDDEFGWRDPSSNNGDHRSDKEIFNLTG